MKQKLCNWNGKEVLLVEVGNNPNVSLYGNEKQLSLKWVGMTAPGKFETVEVKLPHGTYRFAFASPLKPTEAEAGEWVESIGDGMYRNYGSLNVIHDCSMSSAYCNKTALASLSSRIRSEGFEPERTIVLVKL